jgi:hypothetical protein
MAFSVEPFVFKTFLPILFTYFTVVLKVPPLESSDQKEQTPSESHRSISPKPPTAEKRFELLRGPHTSASSVERKIFDDIKSPPFVLSFVEGLRESFSAPC